MMMSWEAAGVLVALFVALGSVAAAIFKAGVQLGGIKDQIEKMGDMLGKQAQENCEAHRHLHGRIDELTERTAVLEHESARANQRN